MGGLSMPIARFPHSSLMRPFLASMFFVVFLLAFTGTGARAHNTFDSSNPSDGSIVMAPLQEWILTFANDVPLDSASAEMVASDGIRTQLPTPTHGATQKTVIFSLPPTLSGEVTGRWRLVSQDGHVVAGRVQFTISAVGGTTTTVDPRLDTDPPVDDTTDQSMDVGGLTLTPEPVRWALRLANYTALLTFGGLLFMNMHVATGSLHLPRALTFANASSIAMTVIPGLQLLIFISDVKDTSLIGAVGHLGMIVDSTPASMLALRALSGGAFVYLLSSRSVHGFDGRFMLLAGVNATVHLIALAYVGHSRSQGSAWLGIPADVLHTAASAVWLGGLAVFLLIVLPAIDEADSLKAFVRYGEAAKYAVITLAATGLVQTLRLHGGITTLFTSPHGRWLLLKILVVGLMLKVGDINRRRLVRSVPLHANGLATRRRMLVRASTTEAVLGATVIAISAVLVTSSLG